ncbi:hypothetical protein Vadar_001622 [Vaccinium darrowii]|uniref:Uncharacterized protein n=1 Tax=Vaccinium darrowii TaxID=229202 RepID=A0ACB7XEN3_9ERIC|nr:hypothetical protein Vadar_001622 [Vaccinium darrowii]
MLIYLYLAASTLVHPLDRRCRHGNIVVGEEWNLLLTDRRLRFQQNLLVLVWLHVNFAQAFDATVDVPDSPGHAFGGEEAYDGADGNRKEGEEEIDEVLFGLSEEDLVVLGVD